jgi:hypothetical protein
MCTQGDAGVGSQLHVLGLALGVAMDTNRVLLLNTDVRHAMYTNDPYCGEQSSMQNAQSR